VDWLSVCAASHAVSHCGTFIVAAANRVHFSVPQDYVTDFTMHGDFMKQKYFSNTLVMG
jgi:hypothetical protein